MVTIDEFVSAWPTSLFAAIADPPWVVTGKAPEILRTILTSLGGDYRVEDDVAVHRSATIEPGAVIKGPAIISENVFVASSAYLRGGVYLDKGCIVGPSCEIKTTLMFPGSKVAHLSFVGDSIVGTGVNIEAGAVVANFRNELEDKRIRMQWRGKIIDTGQTKFGALIGDDVRLGANCVVAPGALLERGTKVPRLGLVDQHPDMLR
jgi:bifunctional UDP-N-acetylglucosamine pyrophosphorylase / glucosamine-1-phosphate N-acetyltransferase